MGINCQNRVSLVSFESFESRRRDTNTLFNDISYFRFVSWASCVIVSHILDFIGEIICVMRHYIEIDD
jgi:hypothetical protein